MGCCPNRHRRLPSMKTMAGDLTGTVIQALRHAIQTGEIIADDDIIRRRLQTCNNCDQKSGIRCLRCGCFISMKAAVLVAECPDKKWPNT